MSKQSYRLLDLAIFTVISVVIEAVNVTLFKLFPFEGFTLSFTIAIGLIALYRWGIYGLVVPLASGVATVLASGVGKTVGFNLAHTVGYLFMAAALIWFRFQDKRNLKGNYLFICGYFFTGFFAVEVGRAVCFLPDDQFLHTLFTCFVLDLLNMAANLGVFLLAVCQPKLVYDQNIYLEELAAEKKLPESALMRESQTNYLALEELAASDQVNDAALLEGGMLTEEDLIALQKSYVAHTGSKSRYETESVKEAQR